MQVCYFDNEEGPDSAHPPYLVALDTLASTKPTLAVLAFQALVPIVEVIGELANGYCLQLGGATAANTPSSYLPNPGFRVGWWRKLGKNKWYGVCGMSYYYGVCTDFCVFADGSAIDTWTLMYHASNRNTSAGVPLASGIQFAYNP